MNKSEFYQQMGECLEKHNFKAFNDTFIRHSVDDILQVVRFSELSSGDRVDIKVLCWVPESQSRPVNSFPDDIDSYVANYLADDRVMYGPYYWKLDSPENISTSFNEIVNSIDRFALPWFSSIDSRKKYTEVLLEEDEDVAESAIDSILNKEKHSEYKSYLLK